ncbi:MAG: hypothetical protein WCI27_03570 [Candidatus Omnitrophota bacterium]
MRPLRLIATSTFGLEALVRREVEAMGFSGIMVADDRFPDFFKRACPDKVRKLFNGDIEVNYYQYYGERPKKEV